MDQSTETEKTVPVLVVGGGPVGLSTAFFLTLHGVKPLVVEQRGTTGQHPRANSSPRTIELFRGAGLGDVLERIGWAPDNPYSMVFKDSGVGVVLARNQLLPHYLRRLTSCTPVPRTIVTSDQLERLLLEQIRARGGEVRFNTRLARLDAHQDGVRAVLVDTVTGQRGEVAADYLVGADGANSAVREWVGLAMPDREVVGTVNTAFYRADVDGRYDRESRFCFVRNDQVYAALGSLNGHDLWVGHIMNYPGKPHASTQLSRERTIELLRAAIGDPTIRIELLAANPWLASLGCASRFRDGRVFLAGDAAHVQTSAGGLGMNTGIQDGHNLAWKLAAVLRGDAAPCLLDSYEAERRPAAAESVEFSREATRGVGIGTWDIDEPGILRDRSAEAHLRAMMFYRYRSAAIIDGAVVDGEQPQTDLDVLHDDARPGYRLPHHWLTSRGDTVSTIDLAGSGWLLLAGPHGHPWVSAAASLPIKVHAHLVTPDLGQAGADLDGLGDPDGGFLEMAGIAADGAVLVRPDGFVCWRATGRATNHTQRCATPSTRFWGTDARKDPEGTATTTRGSPASLRSGAGVRGRR